MKYKYTGKTDEFTTNGKIYNVKSDGTFLDDTGLECCLSYDFEKYFELQETCATISACNDYIEGINMQCARCDEPKYKHRF